MSLLKRSIILIVLIGLMLQYSLYVVSLNNENDSVHTGLSAGRLFGAIIKEDKSLWLWGDNNYGQLGNGNKQTTEYPFNALNDVIDVSCGWNHVAAIKSNGELWMWGSNNGHAINSSSDPVVLFPTKIWKQFTFCFLYSMHTSKKTNLLFGIIRL